MAALCREVSRELHGLSSVTEQDFLAVGGKLEQIVGHARAAAETTSNLLDALGGEVGTELTAALDEVVDWASGTRDASDHGRALDGLLPVVAAVRAPLSELHGATRMLRVAGVVTRVESARLGEDAAGFASLADEVARLSNDIEEKSESVLAAIEELRRLIGRTRETVLESERRQNQELLRLLQECRTGIEELHQDRERTYLVSLGAQEGYRTIVEEVGRMVMALQFHDSTRQRLEHVEAALTGLAERLESPEAAAEAAVVKLQSAQLDEASRAFLASVAKIRADLNAVQSSSSSLVGAARRLAGEESGTGVERCLAMVASTIEEWSESHRVLVSAAADVARGCARVGAFVSDIQEVGTRLLWLALNAEVEAVRLSKSGGVMEAVAEGIGRVSQEASAHAAKAGAMLTRAESTVSGFARDLSGDDGSGDRARQAANQIRSLGAQLKERSARAPRLLSAIVKQGEELSVGIHALAEGLDADAQMERVARSCLASLAVVEKEVSARAPARTAHTSPGELAAAAELYTMEHEREVHTAVAGGVLSDSAAVPQLDDELGSNVELF